MCLTMDVKMDLSLVTSTFDTLRFAPPSKLTLLEAQEFSSAHYPPTPPDMDTLILGVDSRELAAQVKTVLQANYPDEHEVFRYLLSAKVISDLISTKDEQYIHDVIDVLKAGFLGEFGDPREQSETVIRLMYQMKWYDGIVSFYLKGQDHHVSWLDTADCAAIYMGKIMSIDSLFEFLDFYDELAKTKYLSYSRTYLLMGFLTGSILSFDMAKVSALISKEQIKLDSAFTFCLSSRLCDLIREKKLSEDSKYREMYSFVHRSYPIGFGEIYHSEHKYTYRWFPDIMDARS